MRLLGASDLEPLMVQADELEQAGVPPGLAQRVAGLATMFSTFDVVEVAAEAELDVEQVAAVHFRLGERLELHWLRDRIVALPRDDRWRALARAALRDDLYSLHRNLTAEVLRQPDRNVDAWIDGNPATERCLQTLAEIRVGHVFDTTTAAGGRARGAQPAAGERLGRPPAGRSAKRRRTASAARARALAASTSRSLGGALVTSSPSRRADTAATSSTARSNASALACDGLVKPLILRTYCSAAARTSWSVAGGSKL